MKNDYEIRGEITAIIINSKKYGIKEALINTNRLNKAKEHPNSWGVNFDKRVNTFYVTGNIHKGNRKYERTKLHRWLTNAPDRMVVDHRNHDGLDNTDDNLIVCTQAENLQNKSGARSDSKSGVRGVYWHIRSKKWIARIGINGEKMELGCFDDIKEAEIAVKEARAKHMPFSNEARKDVS